MRFGSFRIDRDRLVLEHAGRRVALAPKSVELLAFLVDRSGEVVSKNELLEGLWPRSSVEEANLSQHVYLIRKALGTCEPQALQAIATIPKRGYRFVPFASERTAELAGADGALAAPVLSLSVAPPLPASPRHETLPASETACAKRAFRVLPWLATLMIAVALGRSGNAVPHAHRVPALSADGSAFARLGRFDLDLRSALGIRRSRGYFARTIASDPHNPAGYVGLADAFAMTADYGYGSRPRTTYLHWAALLAKRGAELDDGSAAAHASLGIIAQMNGARRDALRELRRAVALDPAYAPAHHWLGVSLFEDGDERGSLRELSLAVQLNPLSTASNVWLALAEYFARRFDMSIEHGRLAMELDPTRTDALRELGLAYSAKGEYHSALATFGRIPRTSGDAPLVPYLLAGVYAHSGRPQIARQIVERERRHHVLNPELPFTLLALGDTRGAARAVAQLRPRTCREQREFAADPRLDAVRGDVSFRGVLSAACGASD